MFYDAIIYKHAKQPTSISYSPQIWNFCSLPFLEYCCSFFFLHVIMQCCHDKTIFQKIKHLHHFRKYFNDHIVARTKKKILPLTDHFSLDSFDAASPQDVQGGKYCVIFLAVLLNGCLA